MFFFGWLVVSWLTFHSLLQAEHTTAEPPATDSLKESGKNSVWNSSPPTPVKKVEKDCLSESDSTQDMEVVGDTMKAKNSTAKTKTEKPSSPKPSSPSTSMILMRDQEIKNLEPKEDVRGHDVDFKDEDIKDEEEEVKKGAAKVEKMEVDLVKVEAKKEKNDVLVKTTKSFRPSSTPPSETGKWIGMGQIAGCFIQHQWYLMAVQRPSEK